MVCRGSEAGRCADLRQQVHFEVGSEGVRQPHVAGECTQNEVAHLDAAGRDCITDLQNRIFLLSTNVYPVASNLILMRVRQIDSWSMQIFLRCHMSATKGLECQ